METHRIEEDLGESGYAWLEEEVADEQLADYLLDDDPR